MSKQKLFAYSREEIDARVVDHWEFADDFIEGFLGDEKNPRKDANVIVSQRRLYLAIESAYQDIARYKNFHQTDPENDYLDCVKRCAYLVKWIIKFKPIVLIGEDGVDAATENESIDDLELLNELFSMYLFELHLSEEIDLNIAFSDEKLQELSYDLLYRQISVDGWIAAFQIFKDCCFPKFVKEVPFLYTL